MSITVRSFLVRSVAPAFFAAGTSLLVAGTAYAFSESTGQIYLNRGFASAGTQSESKTPTTFKAEETQDTSAAGKATDTTTRITPDK